MKGNNGNVVVMWNRSYVDESNALITLRSSDEMRENCLEDEVKGEGDVYVCFLRIPWSLLSTETPGDSSVTGKHHPENEGATEGTLLLWLSRFKIAHSFYLR